MAQCRAGCRARRRVRRIGLVGSGAVLVTGRPAARPPTRRAACPRTRPGSRRSTPGAPRPRLAPVTEDTGWSAADLAHSTYIVETGDFSHDERPHGTPYFSADGDRRGAERRTSPPRATRRRPTGSFIEQWITAPFHAAGMLDPSSRPPASAPTATPGARRARRGDARRAPRSRRPAPTTARRCSPATARCCRSPQQSYKGGESPDPLSPCSRLQPGADRRHRHPAVRAAAARADRRHARPRRSRGRHAGRRRASYDETSYTNTDADAQTLGRDVLGEPPPGGRRAAGTARPGLDLRRLRLGRVRGRHGPDRHALVVHRRSSCPRCRSATRRSWKVRRARARARSPVSLSRPSSAPVRSTYATAAGTATAGSDFVAKSGTVTHPGRADVGGGGDRGEGRPRSRSRNEMFTVQLSNPQGATLRRATGTVTITTDDSSARSRPTPRLVDRQRVDRRGRRRARGRCASP